MAIPGKDFRGVVVPGRGFGAQRMANSTVLQVVQRYASKICSKRYATPGDRDNKPEHQARGAGVCRVSRI